MLWLCYTYSNYANNPRLILIQYFVLVCLVVIGLGVGTYFIFSGNVDALKQPFMNSLKDYNPDDTSSTARAVVDAWDGFQSDVR